MNSWKLVWTFLPVLLLPLAIGCGSGSANGNDTGGSPDTPPSTGPCTSDADCAPARCCHATSCVLASQAPKDCGETMCSAECVEGSMDCGKGSCACREGTCQVQWRK